MRCWRSRPLGLHERIADAGSGILSVRIPEHTPFYGRLALLGSPEADARQPLGSPERERANLPSARLILAERDRTMSWSEAAYSSSPSLIQERFALEAGSSLPGVLPLVAGLDSYFEGAFAQRTKLRYDQQVPEWSGERYVG